MQPYIKAEASKLSKFLFTICIFTCFYIHAFTRVMHDKVLLCLNEAFA